MALNDIFVKRYDGKGDLFKTTDDRKCRLFLRQISLLEKDDIQKYMGQEMNIDYVWKEAYRALSHELGEDLPVEIESNCDYSFNHCLNWILHETKYINEIESGNYNADIERHIVYGLSIIELFLRIMMDWIQDGFDDGRFSEYTYMNHSSIVEQLNKRLHEAGIPFYYDNGVIRHSEDLLIKKNIEEPFWELISDPRWNQASKHMRKAVETMRFDKTNAVKEAAQALESVIKEIYLTKKSISEDKHSNVTTCINYLWSENVMAKHESEIIKIFFSQSRNPISHPKRSSTPGDPTRWSQDEAVWIVDFCMATIRRLVTSHSW